MSYSLEKEVTTRRKKTPWAEIDLHGFLTDLATYGKISVSCQWRPELASRFWWTIEWTGADEQMHKDSATTLSLLLWRAATMEIQTRARIRRERMTTPVSDVLIDE